jgi:hypothetical protein
VVDLIPAGAAAAPAAALKTAATSR